MSSIFNQEWKENEIHIEHDLLKGCLVWVRSIEAAQNLDGKIPLFLESELDDEVKLLDDFSEDFVFTTIYHNEKLEDYFFKCAIHLKDGSIYDMDTQSVY